MKHRHFEVEILDGTQNDWGWSKVPLVWFDLVVSVAKMRTQTEMHITSVSDLFLNFTHNKQL